jgi:endonuclease III
MDIDIVKVRDRAKSIVVDVHFKRTDTYCGACKADTCEHIDYALTVPKVQEIVMKKIKAGWNLPEPET